MFTVYYIVCHTSARLKTCAWCRHRWTRYTDSSDTYYNTRR